MTQAFEAQVHIRDLDKWLRFFDEATFEDAAEKAAAESLEKAAKVYKREMRKALQPYHWQKSGGVYSSVDILISKNVLGAMATARIGPGVKGKLPEEAEVVATGRGEGKRVPPYGPGSKLFRWATEKGIDTRMVYFIAKRIGKLGIPNRYSKGWPDKPGYVEAALRNGDGAATKALENIPTEIIKIAVRRAP